MSKIAFVLLLLVGLVLLAENIEAKEADCSFRWGGGGAKGYCWKYCKGSSGRWCYTSAKANCYSDSDCSGGAYTLCSDVNWCNYQVKNQLVREAVRKYEPKCTTSPMQ